MAERGNDSGFVDELVDMLVNQPFRTEETDIGEPRADVNIPFNLNAFINTPGRETRASEEQLRGDFAERLPTGDNEFSFAQLFANEATTDIGNEIVLSSILKQLNLPSMTMKQTEGKHAFSGIDILDFFGNADIVSETDLLKARARPLGVFGPEI